MNQMYEFRSRLLAELFADLHGPVDSAEPETIPDEPLSQYVVGVLYPQSDDEIAPDVPCDIDEGEDEATFADPAVALSNVRYPSSIGLTFAVDTSVADSIEVVCTGARYEPPASWPHHQHPTSGNGDGDDADTSPGWSRKPLDLRPVTIPTSSLDETTEERTHVGDGVEVVLRAGVISGLVGVRSSRTKPGSCMWHSLAPVTNSSA